jgi:predicted DNA-binding ribbon-helix-helix protein
MESPVIKRSVIIAGHKTSVSLEDAFWKGLREVADQRDMTLSKLVASVSGLCDPNPMHKFTSPPILIRPPLWIAHPQQQRAIGLA